MVSMPPSGPAPTHGARALLAAPQPRSSQLANVVSDEVEGDVDQRDDDEAGDGVAP